MSFTKFRTHSDQVHRYGYFLWQGVSKAFRCYCQKGSWHNEDGVWYKIALGKVHLVLVLQLWQKKYAYTLKVQAHPATANSVEYWASLCTLYIKSHLAWEEATLGTLVFVCCPFCWAKNLLFFFPHKIEESTSRVSQYTVLLKDYCTKAQNYVMMVYLIWATKRLNVDSVISSSKIPEGLPFPGRETPPGGRDPRAWRAPWGCCWPRRCRCCCSWACLWRGGRGAGAAAATWPAPPAVAPPATLSLS